MIWGKKKNIVHDPPSSVLELATRLGVERRKNVRVNYPLSPNVCKLPEIGFAGKRLRVNDISVGGCCVLDPDEIMGIEIGHDLELEVHWTTGSEKVLARLCARVDERRHIQFINLTSQRQTLLKKFMVTGVRGQSLRRHTEPFPGSPAAMNGELWSSLHGDNAIAEDDMHRVGQIHLMGESFLLFKGAWPCKAPGNATCTRADLERLILFLANVHSPSPALLKILQDLEQQYRETLRGGQE